MPGNYLSLRRIAQCRRRFRLEIVAFVLLAACDTFPLTPTEFDRELQQAPFVVQPQADAWLSTRSAQVVFERRFRGRSEQHILLPNRTAVSGENYILLRSHGSRGANIGRFRPLELLKSAGGIPYPFTAAEIRGMTTETDALGQIDWALWTNYSGLTCVLAFRRFDGANRTIPAGAGAMDLAMRNCVYGTVEEALAPISPQGASFAATGLTEESAPKMLSPLAGPLP